VSLRCTFGIPGQASRTDGGSSGQAETVPVGALNADSLILLDADAEIELQDGSWVNARVGTQCRNRDGRWFLYLCRSPRVVEAGAVGQGSGGSAGHAR
jgi:hypothetical protein